MPGGGAEMVSPLRGGGEMMSHPGGGEMVSHLRGGEMMSCRRGGAEMVSCLGEWGRCWAVARQVFCLCCLDSHSPSLRPAERGVEWLPGFSERACVCSGR